MIPLLWRRTAATRLAVAMVALGLGGGAVLGTQLAASALQGQAQLAERQAAGRAQYDLLPFARTGFTSPQARAGAKLPGGASGGGKILSFFFAISALRRKAHKGHPRRKVHGAASAAAASGSVRAVPPRSWVRVQCAHVW